MSQSKKIIFSILFCLLFCTTELYALDSNELNKTPLSLNSIGKSLGGTVHGIGKSLGKTVNGVGKFMGGTVEGVGEFLDENGEVVLEAVIVVGTVFLFIMAGDSCSYYDNGYHQGYNH
jgi:hypothetical protein